MSGGSSSTLPVEGRPNGRTGRDAEMPPIRTQNPGAVEPWTEMEEMYAKVPTVGTKYMNEAPSATHHNAGTRHVFASHDATRLYMNVAGLQRC